ncbi:MAG TPA: hypothetical protein VEB00_05585 [Clostridia bacterium]|nr:hypothetical protein [Clostridia bacterium]
MDNQNNELKSLNIYNLPRMDLIKEIKIDVNQIPMQSFQPQTISQISKIYIPKKDEPKPKTGIEGWYERNNGKMQLRYSTNKKIQNCCTLENIRL